MWRYINEGRFQNSPFLVLEINYLIENNLTNKRETTIMDLSFHITFRRNIRKIRFHFQPIDQTDSLQENNTDRNINRNIRKAT